MDSYATTGTGSARYRALSSAWWNSYFRKMRPAVHFMGQRGRVMLSRRSLRNRGRTESPRFPFGRGQQAAHSGRSHAHARGALVLIGAALACALALSACSSTGAGGSAGAANDEGTTQGAAWQQPMQTALSSFDANAATGQNGAAIDVSHANDGYVAASATADSRLKLVVECKGQSYNYDLAQDGTPLVAPVNMGNGTYTVRVMRNTNADRYVELCRATVDVALTSEFAPFLVPDCFCSYAESSACVAKARDICAGAQNEGDVVRAVFDYITQNVTYDYDKAAQLSGTTGYVPNPDATLQSGTGICFDYASLGAAMLRSQGIPAKIVTGYVSPSNVYHAWIMVYIDGSWKSARISVDQNTWSRVDLTFTATQGDDRAAGYVGDGSTYTDRYTY